MDYFHHLLSVFGKSHPLIVCLSEHWLHSFDSNFFKVFSDFECIINSVKDDPFFMPKSIRGKGGVALLWSKSLSRYISRVSFPCDDRIVGIRIAGSPNDIIVFSLYLPCQTGCTDNFKSVLDVLDSTFDLFPGATILFAGDLNADIGYSGNRIHHPSNEQGIILHRYLSKWDYISSHLHLAITDLVFTYDSEAHGSSSIIDHILCPKFFTTSFVNCYVLSENPLNMSDHLPVLAEFYICPHSSSPHSSFQLVSNAFIPPRWEGCNGDSILLYSSMVMRSLPIHPQIWSSDSIDLLISTVTDSLLSAASTHIPPKRFHTFVRPNWSPSLKFAQGNTKAAYCAWCAGGRPRVHSNYLFSRYKDFKRLFRQELRKYKRCQRDSFYNSLDLND